MTSAIEVMPAPPGLWSEPSATATPLSSMARTGGQPGRAGAGVTAGVQPRQQARATAGGQDPARLVLGEPAFLAVHVHAVRADRGRVRAPGADRLDVVVAAAEELRRHGVRG